MLQNAFSSWDERCRAEDGHSLATGLWERSQQLVSHGRTCASSVGPGEKGEPRFKVRWFERLHMWIAGVWGTEFDQDSGASGWVR